MKIGIITPMIAPYRVTFFEKLSNLKDIDLVVFHNVKKTEDGRPAFIGKLEFPNETYDIVRLEVLSIYIDFYKNLFSKLKNKECDVLILQAAPSVFSSWVISLWARWYGKKVVFWACGWEPEHSKLLKRIKQIVLKRYFALGNLFIAYSTTAKNYLENNGVNTENIQVAYNGIETDEYQNIKKKVREEAKLLKKSYPSESKIFLYVGGIFKEKQVDLLLRAFSELQQKHKNSVLWVIGDGPDLDSLKLFADNLCLKNVVFFGRIIHGVDKYFCAADVFVLPGIGGLGLNQAMLWDCPCIVSKADGTEEDLVIENKTGFRFSQGDQRSLVTAMEKFLNISNSDYKILCENGRKFVLSKSNVNNMVDVFKDTFLKLKF